MLRTKGNPAVDGRGARRTLGTGNTQSSSAQSPSTQARRAKWRDILPVHPAADLFPMMSPEELRALAEDIKQHGLRNPCPTTVGTVRATLEAKGDVSSLDTSIDTKGRRQPRKRLHRDENLSPEAKEAATEVENRSELLEAAKEAAPKNMIQVLKKINPIALAWNSATKKQRREFALKHSAEILRVQQDEADRAQQDRIRRAADRAEARAEAAEVRR